MIFLFENVFFFCACVWISTIEVSLEILVGICEPFLLTLFSNSINVAG